MIASLRDSIQKRRVMCSVNSFSGVQECSEFPEIAVWKRFAESRHGGHLHAMPHDPISRLRTILARGRQQFRRLRCNACTDCIRRSTRRAMAINAVLRVKLCARRDIFRRFQMSGNDHRCRLPVERMLIGGVQQPGHQPIVFRCRGNRHVPGKHIAKRRQGKQGKTGANRAQRNNGILANGHETHRKSRRIISRRISASHARAFDLLFRHCRTHAQIVRIGDNDRNRPERHHRPRNGKQ